MSRTVRSALFLDSGQRVADFCPRYRSITSRAVATAALVLLTGCFADVKPPPDLAGRESPTAERFAATQPSASTTQPAVTPDGWVGQFRDDTLASLVAEAIAHNPDLRESAARVQEARENVTVAASQLYPELDGVGSASRQKVNVGINKATAQYNLYQVGGEVSWELDLWGRIRASTKAEQQTLAATELDYAASRLSLAVQVADAWFVAIQAKQQIAIDEERLATEAKTLRITTDKVAVGVGGQLDAELQGGTYRAVLDALQRDHASFEQAVRALEVLLGRYPSAELQLASDLPAFPNAVAVGLPSDLLERRPDLLAAGRRVFAAFYTVQSRQAARLPSVTLSADFGWLVDPNTGYWSIASNLLAPIFTGGRLEAQVRAASAQQRQAIDSYVSTAITAFQEVENALSGEHYLAVRENELRQADEHYRNASRVGEDRYNAGILGIVDLTTVRRTDFENRATLLQVRTDRLRQRLTLYRALGGTFDGPSAEVVMVPKPGGGGLVLQDTAR